MPDTFIKIASVTVGSGGASSIEFTSIPATFTDLLIFTSTRSNSATESNYYRVRFNSSTTNYSGIYLQGTGNSLTNGSFETWGSTVNSTATANTFDNSYFYVPNYAGSTNKSVSGDNTQENNATLSRMNLVGGLWSDTSAITSVQIVLNAGNFVQYSTATLYGIKNS